MVSLLLLRCSTQGFRLSISAAESPQQVDRKDSAGACSTTDFTSNRHVESPPPQPYADGDGSGATLDAGTSREKFLRDVVGVGVGVAAGISYEPQPAYALFGERGRSRSSTLRVVVAAAAAAAVGNACGVCFTWLAVRESRVFTSVEASLFLMDRVRYVRSGRKNIISAATYDTYVPR